MNHRCVIDFIESNVQSEQDIIFHTSIRLDQKAMVRNALINKRWGMEDRYGPFQFAYNSPFEIIFLAEYEHYKIAVNGVHIGVFRHQLPLHLVNFVHVSGDVKIDHVVLEQDAQSAQTQNVISSLITSTSSFPMRRVNTTTIPIQPGPPSTIQIHQSTSSVPAYNMPNASAPPIYSAPLQVNYQPPPRAPHNPHHQQPPPNPWVS